MADYMATEAEENIQGNDDARLDPAAVGARWKGELERSARYFQKWKTRSEKIEKIYLDQQNEDSANRSFPMLWANMSVLQPAVYARTPVPAVDRRFKDTDTTARIAAEMLERVLTFSFDSSDIDTLMRQVRDDFLLFARGVAWLRYEADFEADEPAEPSETLPEEQQEAAQLAPQERIKSERICYDYVHWSDFLHSPARNWKDVTWVARRVPMGEDEFEERFGADALATTSADSATKNNGTNETDRAQNEGKIYVWEIWCKDENYSVWIADGASVALEVSDPPLQLEGFFPCPRPAFGTTSTGSIIPVPDYVYYQGQVEEIDALTKRMTALTDQLRLVGFYPSGDGDISAAIERALQPGSNAIMVPIPSWAAFADKGGANAIVWMPVDQVQKVLMSCVEARKQLIDDVYQITGISDIVRGDTQASETATAQRIKSQWGSIRIRDRQAELARFARDIVRISGEMIGKLFQPETLIAMSGLQLPTNQMKMQAQQQMQMQMVQYQHAAQMAQMQGQQPPPQPQPPQGFDQMMQSPSIEDVVQLLRDDGSRGFRIDIETDSTIEPDEDAEKQRRMEFAQVVGGFIQQAVPVVQQMPSLVPAVGEILLFVARGFRAGRQLETVLEQAIGQTAQIANQPKPPPQPSPDEMLKTKAEQAKAQSTIQTTQIKAQAEAQKAQMEVQAAALDHHATLQKIEADARASAMKHQHEMAKSAMTAQNGFQ